MLIGNHIVTKHLRFIPHKNKFVGVGVLVYDTECGEKGALFTTDEVSCCSCIDCLTVYFARLDGVSVEEYKRRRQDKVALELS